MKRITLLICLVIMLTGCAKERGEIAESHPELYYLKTSYYDQNFSVINHSEVPDGHRITITTDLDMEIETPYSVEPNKYITTTVSNEWYEKYIAGYDLFQATLDVMTVVNPENGNMYVYISDSVKESIIKAANSSDCLTTIPKEEIEKYLSKYKFIYYKL